MFARHERLKVLQVVIKFCPNSKYGFVMLGITHDGPVKLSLAAQLVLVDCYNDICIRRNSVFIRYIILSTAVVLHYVHLRSGH